MPETDGESLFRAYLDAHGYYYEQPDVEDRNNPAADFRIFRNGRPLAVAEVKQWDEYVDPKPPGGSVGMVDLKQLYRPVAKPWARQRRS